MTDVTRICRQRCPIFAIVLLWSGLTISTGCQSTQKPIAHGPWYEFPSPVIAEATTAPVSIVPVTFRDDRPGWERHYYQGGEEPEEYVRGITFLAAENFRPDLQKYIEKTLAARLANHEQVPTWVEFRLESFQVVVNKTEFLQALYAKQCAEEDTRRRKESQYSFGASVSSDGSSDLTGALVGAAIVGLAVATKEAAAAEQILQGPPPELSDHFPAGITCEIRATAVIHHGKQDRRTIPLSITSRTPYNLAQGTTVEQDVVPTVQHAVNQLVDHCFQEAVAPVAPSFPSNGSQHSPSD